MLLNFDLTDAGVYKLKTLTKLQWLVIPTGEVHGSSLKDLQANDLCNLDLSFNIIKQENYQRQT